jgi:preprotein translocase subunit YajC
MRLISFMLLIAALSASAFAQTAAPGAGNSAGFMGSVLPMMIIMFAIIYFLMIRPEQKKQKQRQKMMTELKKGDRILTIGGIFGTVGNVKDNTIMVKIAENTVVELRKGAIAEVVVDKPAESGKDKEGSK